MTIFVIDPNNPLPSEPIISNFDPTQDFIQLPNPSADEVLTYFSYTDYNTLETVGSDAQILTTDGDLAAIIEGVTELRPFTGYTPNESIYLVSLENEFLSNFIEPSFFEPWYLEQDASDYGNSVQEAIDAGINAPDVYYLGQENEDYAFIQNFDPYKDFIFAVGKFADYTFETVDATWEDFGRVAPIKNLEISYQGDLVAVLYDSDFGIFVMEAAV